MNKSIIIAGAGLGGLTTALRLAKRGFNVEIIEKNERAGGRLNQVKKDGFTFDTGPSFFSMSRLSASRQFSVYVLALRRSSSQNAATSSPVISKTCFPSTAPASNSSIRP